MSRISKRLFGIFTGAARKVERPIDKPRPPPASQVDFSFLPLADGHAHDLGSISIERILFGLSEGPGMLPRQVQIDCLANVIARMTKT